MSDSMMDQKLYECLQKVKSYLMKIGASKEDAEDIVQETAYKFILYMDSIGPHPVESWLYRVTICTGTERNLVLIKLRSKCYQTSVFFI